MSPLGVMAQAQKPGFKLKAPLYFSQSKFETRCFQVRVELAPPYRVALHHVDHFVFLLQAGDDAVNGLLEVRERHRGGTHARRHQRRLVAHVGDVGASKARRERGEALRVVRHGGVELDVRQVHFEDLVAALDVGVQVDI